MIRTAYKLVNDPQGTGAPLICKVEITDLDGVSWREAKKQLRQWHLDQIANLRGVTERGYFTVPSQLVTYTDLDVDVANIADPNQ